MSDPERDDVEYEPVTISVGIRNTGCVDIDMAIEDENGKLDWNHNSLSIQEAQFLIRELSAAIERLSPTVTPKAFHSDPMPVGYPPDATQ